MNKLFIRDVFPDDHSSAVDAINPKNVLDELFTHFRKLDLGAYRYPSRGSPFDRDVRWPFIRSYSDFVKLLLQDLSGLWLENVHHKQDQVILSYNLQNTLSNPPSRSRSFDYAREIKYLNARSSVFHYARNHIQGCKVVRADL